MKASKIEHNGESRIKIDFPYNVNIAETLKQIEGARWSKTYRAWHIPYNPVAFKHLLRLFPDIEYPITKQVKVIGPKTINCNENIELKDNLKNGVNIEIIGRKIFLKMPKDYIDIKFIRSIQYSQWNSGGFVWVIPHYPGNIEMIKEYFKERIKSLIIHESFDVNVSSKEVRNISKNTVLVIKVKTGRLKIIFAYNKELSLLLNRIPYCTWNSPNKWWSVPYSQSILANITNLVKEQNMEIIIEDEKVVGELKPRLSPLDIPNYRFCPEEFHLKLTELRYSGHTIKLYKSMFEEFINYYHKYEIQRINEVMITAFLRYLVMERKVSSSYQNLSINAIKFYYERVLGGERRIYTVDRPKVEKTLPIVMNEEEIIKIFSCIKNIKHKAVLMVIYSAGLRLNEAINLKLSDFDYERMQIRIQQSKGKKDRYTLFSTKLKDFIESYILEYKPVTWFVEGAKIGKRYSGSSIQRVFQKAIEKAGINKEVSVHTLRHSFATHLLEGGTDLRYIQNLLGHESSKTTEMYTHITTKGFDQIKSPIDKLDIF